MLSCIFNSVPVETCSIKKKKWSINYKAATWYRERKIFLWTCTRAGSHADRRPKSWQPFIYFWNSEALQMVLRGWLVYGGTTHPKSVSTVPVLPASPQVEGEVSQLPKVLISNPSLAFLMAGTVKAQDGPWLHILCGNRIMLWSFKQASLGWNLTPQKERLNGLQ